MPHRVRIIVEAVDVMSSLYPSLPVSVDWSSEIVVGSASDEADTVIRLRYTIAGSGTQAIDLTALTDAAGKSVSLAEVHLIAAMAGAADRFTITPAGSNGFSGLGSAYSTPVHRGPTTVYHRPSGVTVTSSDKALTITNTEAAQGTIDLLIIGRAA